MGKYPTISKITEKILDEFRRKEKTTAIFFNIKKAYDKINKDKTLEQLENMGIQVRMLRFISERWIKVKVGGSVSQSKQTDFGVS